MSSGLRTSGKMVTTTLHVTAQQASAWESQPPPRGPTGRVGRIVSHFRIWKVVTVKPGALIVTEVNSAYRVALHFRGSSPSIYSPTPFGSGLFLECTRAAGLPTAANLLTSMLLALGTQTPHDLKTVYNSLMVLLSSRLTGPCPASNRTSSQMAENAALFSTTSLFKERAY